MFQRRSRKLVKAKPGNKVVLEKGTEMISVLEALWGGEKVVTGSANGTLRVFEADSGECLHVVKGHTDHIWEVVQVDQDTFASAGREEKLRLWKISDGEMREVAEVDCDVFSMASWGDGRLVLVMKSTEVRLAHWKGEAPLVLGDPVEEIGPIDTTGIYWTNWYHNSASPFRSETNWLPPAISAHGSRFAIAIRWKTRVWEWQFGEAPRLLATLDTKSGTSTRVSLSDAYLIIGDGMSLLFYDATSFELQRKISVEDKVTRVMLVSNSQRCVSLSLKDVSGDPIINVHDISTGALLWRWKANDRIDICTVLAAGRIAVAGLLAATEVVSPPPHIADQIAPVYTQAVDDVATPPGSLLQSALDSVQSGHSSAAEQCRALISAENCSVSFAEWRSAHQLLMLAVCAGDIPPATSFEGRRNWWFLELYSVARHFTDTNSAQDFHALQACLEEAMQAGVIQSAEAVLGDAVLTQEFRKEIRALHQAGVMLCQRLLCIEERVQSLSDSFTRYKNVERTSKLLGIALQLIPIAGGAAAGVLSAGAEIVDGLSLKDIVDYAMGAVDVSDEEILTFADRVFGRARKSIAVEAINSLAESKRRELEEVVQYSGYSIEALRVLFQDPSREIFTTTTISLQVGGSPSAADEASSNDDKDVGLSQYEEGESQENTGTEGCSSRGLRHVEFNNRKISREVIGKSSAEDLARMWTAFILQSEDETAEFLALSRCIQAVLSQEDISGSLLVLPSAWGMEALKRMRDLVLKALGETDEVTLTVGKELWARQFVDEVSQTCHGEDDGS